MTAVGLLDWQTQAACRGMSVSQFIREEDELPAPEATAACAVCPVQALCLQWALEHDEVGLWGGMTDSQRRAIDSTRDRVKCIACGSRTIYADGHNEICLSCGLGWKV